MCITVFFFFVNVYGFQEMLLIVSQKISTIPIYTVEHKNPHKVIQLLLQNGKQNKLHTLHRATLVLKDYMEICGGNSHANQRNGTLPDLAQLKSKTQ